MSRLTILAVITLFRCSQSTLQARSQLLSINAPFSFLETLVVGPNGSLYLLDTNLSSLFTIDGETSSVKRICGTDKSSSPADLAVDRKGNLWVLSAFHSRILKLTSQCDVQREIVSKSLPRRGEPVLSKSRLGGTSDSFDLFEGQDKTTWKVFTQTNPDFAFRVEYPPDWSVEENKNVYLFAPPHIRSNKDSIAIVVINYDKTPPLPIQHTYTTVRTVTVDAEEILVRKRQPSPATEKYFAERKKGGYVAEFRFSLDSENDAVFDHMLSTFTFTFIK